MRSLDMQKLSGKQTILHLISTMLMIFKDFLSSHLRPQSSYNHNTITASFL